MYKIVYYKYLAWLQDLQEIMQVSTILKDSCTIVSAFLLQIASLQFARFLNKNANFRQDLSDFAVGWPAKVQLQERTLLCVCTTLLLLSMFA